MNCYNCGFNQLVCDTQKDSYVCKKCGYEYPKQYFFISHSHRDIEKVRIVRNIIEETFFYEPILFFLKCLSDNTELTDLLKREINERIWFVYCKSENAEKSKYVQFEREYIKKIINAGKKIHVLEVDIDKYDVWNEECTNYIRSQIEYKIRKTQLFLSYTRKDAMVANLLKNKLKEHSFTLFDQNEMFAGSLFEDEMKSQIKNSSYKNGAILQLISSDYFNSQFAINESKYAFSQGACIIPVVLATSDDEACELINKINYNFEYLKDKKVLTINLNKLEESLLEVVDYLLNY